MDSHFHSGPQITYLEASAITPSNAGANGMPLLFSKRKPSEIRSKQHHVDHVVQEKSESNAQNKNFGQATNLNLRNKGLAAFQTKHHF